MRDGARQPAGDATPRCSAGDVLLVRASPDEMASIKDEPGLALNALAKYWTRVRLQGSGCDCRRAGQGESRGPREAAGENQLVQVVVGPGSEFASRTVGNIDFLRTLGVLVVGLRRRESWIARRNLRSTSAGGRPAGAVGRSAERYAELAQHRGFLMMVPFTARPRWRPDARRSRSASWPAWWLPPQPAWCRRRSCSWPVPRPWCLTRCVQRRARLPRNRRPRVRDDRRRDSAGRGDGEDRHGRAAGRPVANGLSAGWNR